MRNPGGDHPTTQFSSEDPGYVYDMGVMTDESHGVADTPDDQLSAFFARPVPIGTYTWSNTISFFQTFKPWELFLNQKRVANRISNYRNIRGRMHMRFMINGTPFHYGCMLVHAYPLPVNDTFNLNRGLILADAVAASQQPHIYLNPTNSQGGDLVLPFIWQFNAMNVVTAQFDNAWEVSMRSLSNLKVINNTTNIDQTVNIRVVAWVEDFQFSSPTNHNIDGILPQSGKEDEYGDKPVSTAANILAKTSGALRNVPVIGKYARAAEMTSRMVGDVANALGYSRPVDISSRNAMEIHPFGSMASCNLPDAAVKLSMDAKKEVTIDPTTVGLSGEDEMHLSTIARRESFVTGFTWVKGAAAGTPLFYSRVNPSMNRKLDLGFGIPEIHMTPSCWICVPFEYWRGSMDFRFKVVASNFHKGRLRISYDPIHSEAADDFNTVRNHIVDIGETKDFTIRIGWSSEQTFLKCASLTETMYSNAFFAGDNAIDNGTIKIEVFTELTTPDDNYLEGECEILMFTSMCEDFEVASPRSAILSNMTYNVPYTPESGYEPQSGVVLENTEEPDIPLKEEVEDTLGPDLIPAADAATMICFGESITSWRQCLKRYSYFNTFAAWLTTSGSQWNMSKHWRPDFPIYRGRQADGVHLSTDGPYNYVSMTIINWVVPAYVGWRGALRWKYISCISNAGILQVVRTPVNQGWNNFEYDQNIAASDQSDISRFWRENWSATWQGGHATPAAVNPVVNVEIPYYNANRFSSARRKNMMLPLTEYRSHTINHFSTALNPLIASYVAAGDDFNCFMFLSVPVCWNVGVDPPTA